MIRITGNDAMLFCDRLSRIGYKVTYNIEPDYEYFVEGEFISIRGCASQWRYDVKVQRCMLGYSGQYAYC